MSDAIISRRGGSFRKQALAPTITEVSTSDNIIVFTLTNNDTESAVILYETNDEVPDENSIELAGGATSGNLTISGLTVSPAILYASANVVGKVKSNITERSFTFTVLVYTEATGGTTLDYNSGGKRFRSHTFTSNGTFTVTTVGENIDDRNKLDYLVVAGGGSGGGGASINGGGGGGAGGFLTTITPVSSDQNPNDKVTAVLGSFNVTVGGGGASRSSTTGNDGDASIVEFPFPINATRGGGGGFFGNGRFGGSGGGSGADSSSRTGGTSVLGQGRNGGNTAPMSGGVAGGGGGGGGAGGVGGNVSQNSGSGGGGGAGLVNILQDATSVIFSAGGRGSNGNSTNTVNGPENTGNGGTGSQNGNASGAGGSGIVVIRYEIPPSI